VSKFVKIRENRWRVIALGGSVVRPNRINSRFVRRFRSFLLPFLAKGFRFVIVIGGGSLAREYQRAAKEIVHVPNEDLDWIGIHATRLNAHLLRTIFRKEAHPVVLDNPEKSLRVGQYRLIFASGWRPGWSTDYIAARLAKRFRARMFVIAGKPAYVYDRDHALYKNAKPIQLLSWRNYRKICGGSWKPGLHAPVDPVAARYAQSRKLCAVVVRGTDLANLRRVFEGKSFRGTVVG